MGSPFLRLLKFPNQQDPRQENEEKESVRQMARELFSLISRIQERGRFLTVRWSFKLSSLRHEPSYLERPELKFSLEIMVRFAADSEQMRFVSAIPALKWVSTQWNESCTYYWNIRLKAPVFPLIYAKKSDIFRKGNETTKICITQELHV